MKKTVLLVLISIGVMAPASSWAQKSKVKKQPRGVITPATRLATSSDTISYAFGASMVEGLPQYLSQQGVLVDTMAINAQFKQKIEAETNSSKQTSLQKEWTAKLDSANTVNSVNIDQFVEGFKSAFSESKGKEAFNSGVAIASQVEGMTQRFSEEVLSGEGTFNKEVFIQGFISNIKKEKLLIDNPQEIMQSKVTETQRVKEAAQSEAAKAQYSEQIAAGEKFLAENKNKAGVVTLPSGLQYKVLVEGKGATPKDNERVNVHYHGTLTDGTVFDSSVERGEPISFNVGQLIQGWNEALVLMPTGSKWELYIPYDLAYGEREQGVIKPFSALIFDVELLSVGGE